MLDKKRSLTLTLALLSQGCTNEKDPWEVPTVASVAHQTKIYCQHQLVAPDQKIVEPVAKCLRTKVENESHFKYRDFQGRIEAASLISTQQLQTENFMDQTPESEISIIKDLLISAVNSCVPGTMIAENDLDCGTIYKMTPGSLPVAGASKYWQPLP